MTSEMNDGRTRCTCVINQALDHVSIRKFKTQEVPDDDILRIVEAARHAPTAWNLMPVSIITVKENSLKRKISEALGGQPHVAKAPAFMIFTVDYAKIVEAWRKTGLPSFRPGMHHFMPALLDAGIMAGWAALAAESLGYGICFIAVYSNPCKVAEILGLPQYVIPVVGFVIGVPDESPSPRPRQSIKAVHGINGYGANPVERGDDVLRVFEGSIDILKYVVGKGGYNEASYRKIMECLHVRGFTNE